MGEVGPFFLSVLRLRCQSAALCYFRRMSKVIELKPAKSHSDAAGKTSVRKFALGMAAIVTLFAGVAAYAVWTSNVEEQRFAQLAPPAGTDQVLIEMFGNWSAQTIDQASSRMLSWSGAGSKVVGVEHTRMRHEYRFLEHQRIPPGWIVFAISSTGRYFTVTAQWDYERQVPVFSSHPQEVTKGVFLQRCLERGWGPRLNELGIEQTPA
jgi:hypothetical protein